MANKTVFKSLIGKLMPATDALNEEYRRFMHCLIVLSVFLNLDSVPS
jgi:hypothetical protein